MSLQCVLFSILFLSFSANTKPANNLLTLDDIAHFKDSGITNIIQLITVDTAMFSQSARELKHDVSDSFRTYIFSQIFIKFFLGKLC